MIEEVIVDNVESLLFVLNDCPNHFIFRGQSDAQWELNSSLERLIGDNWIDDNATRCEEFSLVHFKSKFHLYDRENESPNSLLSWLAAMQHYGIPTRMIDFTESPYVALYFAIESFRPNDTASFAIYAIDYKALMKASIEYIRSVNRNLPDDQFSVASDHDGVFEKYVNSAAHQVAWVAEPTRSNSRLDRQRGTFLVSGDRRRKIQSVLDGEIYSEVVMKKLIINANLWTSCYSLLRKMNITSKTLFGDLAGLANSIRMELVAHVR